MSKQRKLGRSPISMLPPKANFFETRVSQYIKASVGRQDQAFVFPNPSDLDQLAIRLQVMMGITRAELSFKNNISNFDFSILEKTVNQPNQKDTKGKISHVCIIVSLWMVVVVMNLVITKGAGCTMISAPEETYKLEGHDGMKQEGWAGALVQSLNDANIGTIHGSLFSNNQIHHHHHHPQADDDVDYAEIKVRDIILETELGSGDIHYDLQSDGTLVKVGRIHKYTGRLFHQPHGSMLIHKYEGLATRNWKRDFHCLAGVRHPIIQLYGLCRSRHFPALIFHNVQQKSLKQYHLSLAGPSFITCISDLLQGANVPQSAFLPRHKVDYAGQLVVDSFSPAWISFQPFLSSLSSASDLKTLASTIEHHSLTRSSLVKYYDLLGLVCSVHDSPFSIIKDVSITHKGITTKLCPPLPYIARSCQDSKEILIELEYVSDILRCIIPVSQLQDQPVNIMPYSIQLFSGGIKSMPYDPLYLWYDHKQSAGKNRYWSTDPEGQILVSNTEIEDHFNLYIYTRSYHIPQQIYTILWDIHKACGFDPESTEMAEYLEYPLLEPRGGSESVASRFNPSAKETKTSEDSEAHHKK
ncbi:hypothetical protein C8J56DRAFT_1100581 [Mycena floridula]|nr:hypothetical protein C8J56DRAFT_1100581 [Mycena floridula]